MGEQTHIVGSELPAEGGRVCGGAALQARPAQMTGDQAGELAAGVAGHAHQVGPHQPLGLLVLARVAEAAQHLFDEFIALPDAVLGCQDHVRGPGHPTAQLLDCCEL